MKRSSWLDVLAQQAAAPSAMTPKMRQQLTQLDELLFDLWNLGDKIVLAWTREGDNLRFLAVRNYAIIETAGSELINSILSGPKFLPPGRFTDLCEHFGTDAHVPGLALTAGKALESKLVDHVVSRYGVSLVRERAVVLLDAVGFSLRSPLEQVSMLNSMSYSVNSAHRQLLSKNVQINFARTTTGDGFYVWNRARTPAANIALYKLMMLILADNAIAATKAKRFPVPQLRAAFHVGEHYEFHQVEALNPTTFAYIVGQVTIDLSRLVEKALPGQILLGDFSIEWPKGEQPGGRIGTLDFVERSANAMDGLNNLVVGEDRIERIRCYLTGERSADHGFGVTRYEVRDKHGFSHAAYNAKINIHRYHSQPIFLGLQNKDVSLTVRR